MDLYCGICSEPFDNDSLHDIVDEGRYGSYAEAASAFRSKGCAAFGTGHNEDMRDNFKSQVASALMDVLGDDMDGFSSTMDDFDYIGAFD